MVLKECFLKQLDWKGGGGGEKRQRLLSCTIHKLLCNLHSLKARLRLLCNKYQRHSSLNLVSRQLKLCNIFIFGMAY